MKSSKKVGLMNHKNGNKTINISIIFILEKRKIFKIEQEKGRKK
jgi:hypothetical protein